MGAPLTNRIDADRRILVADLSPGVLALMGNLGSGPTNNLLRVDKGGSDVSGQRGKAALPFGTLQAAVNAAKDGDVIIVGPGTYDDVTLARKISIHGVDPRAVVVGNLTWTPTGSGDELITLAGLTVNGNVAMNATGKTDPSVTCFLNIKDCVFRGNRTITSVCRPVLNADGVRLEHILPEPGQFVPPGSLSVVLTNGVHDIQGRQTLSYVSDTFQDITINGDGFALMSHAGSSGLILIHQAAAIGLHFCNLNNLTVDDTGYADVEHTFVQQQPLVNGGGTGIFVRCEYLVGPGGSGHIERQGDFIRIRLRTVSGDNIVTFPFGQTVASTFVTYMVFLSELANDDNIPGPTPGGGTPWVAQKNDNGFVLHDPTAGNRAFDILVVTGGFNSI